jgi:hypothetical protein
MLSDRDLHARRMVPSVQEDVAEGIPDLARRLKWPHVVAVGEDPPRPMRDPIHDPSQSRPDRFMPPARDGRQPPRSGARDCAHSE